MEMIRALPYKQKNCLVKLFYVSDCDTQVSLYPATLTNWLEYIARHIHRNQQNGPFHFFNTPTNELVPLQAIIFTFASYRVCSFDANREVLQKAALQAPEVSVLYDAVFGS